MPALPGLARLRLIHARIQHHPARASLIPELLERLRDLPTEVMAHASIPPSPWAGYVRCLTDIPDCSHLLIVQDDVVPVPNFAAAVRRVAARHPDTPVCLFLSKWPSGTASRAKRAVQRKQLYAVMYPVAPFVPIVAVLWPREKAVQFLEWAQSGVRLPGHPDPRSDDSILARWVKVTRQDFFVTVPSLVEHLDVPSVKGVRNAPTGWKAMFLAEDANDYEW